MSRIGVLIAAAMALAACSKGASQAGGDGKKAEAKKAGEAGDSVSVSGVISAVEPDRVRVRTDDGRELALKLDEAVSVTLAGGKAETAVITEGAPVRVSYRPKGSGGDLVTVDVEPQATTGRGEAKKVPQSDPPANPASQGR
jgi:ABC-type Fe3+-hydroxamate transport system substrate-binding protein